MRIKRSKDGLTIAVYPVAPKQSVGELIASWERLVEILELKAKRSAKRDDYGHALEFAWFSTGVAQCLADIKKLGAEAGLPLEIRLSREERRRLLAMAENEGLEAFVKRKLYLRGRAKMPNQSPQCNAGSRRNSDSSPASGMPP